MTVRKQSLFFLALCFPILMTAQKYLSTESPEITHQWKNHTFSSDKTITENIEAVPELSFMAKVLEEPTVQAGIEKEEMVTIFLVSDKMLATLNKKQKDSIVGNKRLLSAMAKFVTIPGRIDKNGLEKAIVQHGGTAYLRTLAGEDLAVTQEKKQLFLIDSKGRKSPITSFNFYHKNGLFHIVDGLVLPKTE